MTYGDNSWGVALAAIAVLGPCVAYLIWAAKSDRTDNKTFLTGLGKLVSSNTRAVKASDKYLRDRNGRDSEFHKETLKALEAIPITMQTIADTQAKAIVDALKKQMAEKDKV